MPRKPAGPLVWEMAPAPPDEMGLRSKPINVHYLEAVKNFVYQAGNLWLKRMANWAKACFQSLGGMIAEMLAFFKARKMSFIAASSEGKEPFVLMTLRIWRLTPSMELVV